jgi:glycosyltransferase involved in cell wall biosynthesis
MVEKAGTKPKGGALRVAHVGGYKPDSASGPSKAIVGMLQNLPHHGVQVELWHFDQRAREVARREIDGIPVLDLPSPSGRAGFFINLPRQTQEALRARCENARAGPLLSVPYVISPRGGYNRRVLHGRNRLAKKIWLALKERRYISSADALHAVSLGEVSELKELVPPERIFYVPNGIEQHVLERPLKDPAGKTLLFLGRVAMQHKGIDLLLAGYAEFLRESNDKSSDLVIAGPDFRGDRQAVEEQIRELGLQDRVSLPGGVYGDEKWDLIDRAYAFVLTSRWEGMPFALLEALAAGRPALVTPGTNVGDLVQRYGAGTTVAGDVASIARGIETMLGLSREDYIRMRNQARRLMHDRFTWENLMEELATHYRRIVRGPA